MDEEEKDKPVTQIPLLGNDELEDMVFDASLPLKPPRKPRRDKDKKRIQYSPVADPDTIDLFDEHDDIAIDIDEDVAEELRQNADEVIDSIVDEYTTEIGKRLRQELSTQLASILEDLHHLPGKDV